MRKPCATKTPSTRSARNDPARSPCTYSARTRKGAARGDSDVDLAVLLPEPLPAVARWELQQRLAAALGRDVDLVDLRAASTVMRVEVLRHAVVLYQSDRRMREEFEAVALASYARLNEERRAIVADARERGTVHG